MKLLTFMLKVTVLLASTCSEKMTSTGLNTHVNLKFERKTHLTNMINIDKELMQSAQVKQAPKLHLHIWISQPRAVGFVLDAAAAGPWNTEKESLPKKSLVMLDFYGRDKHCIYQYLLVVSKPRNLRKGLFDLIFGMFQTSTRKLIEHQ